MSQPAVLAANLPANFPKNKKEKLKATSESKNVRKYYREIKKNPLIIFIAMFPKH